MLLQAVQAVAPAVRFTALLAILLLVLYALQDAVGSIGSCFDRAHPWAPERQPFCILLSYGFLDEGLDKSDLAGLLWHYLPSIVAALAIAWTLKSRRRTSPVRMHLPGRFVVLLLALSILYDLSVQAHRCFSPRPPILPETVPLCSLTHFEMLAGGWGRSGFPGLLWYFLPPIVAAVLVTVVWARSDRRRART